MPRLHFRPINLRASTGILAVAATVASSGILPWFGDDAAATTQPVIIELEEAPALNAVGKRRAVDLRTGDGDARAEALKAYRAVSEAIEAAQKDVIGTAKSKGVSLSNPRHITGVLNAIVADVDPADIKELRAMPGVARVTRDKRVGILTGNGDKTEQQSPAPTGTPSAAPTEIPTPTETPSAAPTKAPAATPTETPAATESTPSPAREASANASLGEGTTVAILDTGIDYTLADLGAGFGEGFKVVDGYDFVNDDADPMDDHYHGTHVAGIVAGTGAQAITGVAPGATLTAYKVLNDDGAGDWSWVLAGLEAAADPTGDHPADIINMSLGGYGDGRDPIGQAAGNISKSGALVVAAAGNSGPSQGTIGTPAAADGVLAVGASITELRLPTATLVSPVEREVVTWRTLFSASPPAEGFTAPVVDVGRGTEEDFDRVGDVTGKIVVYQAPAPQSIDALWNDALPNAQRAERRGALAALTYWPSDAEQRDEDDAPAANAVESGVVDLAPTGAGALGSGDDHRLDTLVLMGMTATEYSRFRPDVVAGTVRMTISSVDATDQIASFSSRGPTVHGLIKPEVVAPGYHIRSTIPAFWEYPDNAYRASGTSMAAPHVAGVAAIAHANKPGISPVDLRSQLIGSAVPLAGASRTLSPAVQGAGRVNVESALAATVVASPNTLAFGQADADGDPSVSLELTLTNPSTDTLTAHLDVEPSATSQGTLSLGGSDLTVAPGASATVTVTAAATVSEIDSELSGVIVARLSDGSEVRVPYLQMSRRLHVEATPEPSGGDASILVSSFLPLEEAPTLTIEAPDGKAFTVRTAPADTMPGWYKADVSSDTIGVHRISATAESGTRTMMGAGTFEVIAGATDTAVWQQLGRDGSSAQLAVSPVAPGTAMQRTSTSVRPFVTTDHGVTWSHIRSLPVANGSGKLIADPSSGTSFWYAVNATREGRVLDPSYMGKLLRTENLGKTWSLLPMPDKHVLSISNDGEKLAAVVADGVEVSRDGGRSWENVPFTWPADIRNATLHRGDLYAVGYKEIWKVADVFGRAPDVSQVHSIDDPYKTFIGIAGAGSAIAASSNDGVEVSTDGGVSWKPDTTLPRRTYTLGIQSIGNEFFMGGLNEYYRSPDAGRTWKVQRYPFRTALAVDFDRWPDRPNSLLLPLEEAGLFESKNDGKSFQRIGVSATTIDTVIADTNAAGKPIVMIADDLGVASKALPTRAKLPDDATEWGLSGTEASSGVATSDLEQDAVSKETLWKVFTDASGGAAIQGSVDAGKTWTSAEPGAFGFQVRDLEASPTVSGHVAASFVTLEDRGILVTHDSWQHWETYSHGINIRSITIDPHNNSRLWLAADDGLYRSDDGGVSITRVFAGQVGTVWVDPVDANRVLAGGRGLWVSNDGGATFVQAETGADVYIRSFASAPVPGTDKSVLFAGSTAFRPGYFWAEGRGVLASLDGGAAWSNVSAAIGTTSVTALDASADGKWLLAGTRQGGLYRADVSALIALVK